MIIYSRSILVLLVLGSILGLSTHCLADEFLARAEVLSAVPIVQTTHKKVMNAECRTGKPEVEDLVTLLEWDLGLGYCETKRRQETSVTGYRVHYLWQGQTYSQTTREDPGSYLPIKVSVN